MIFIISFILLLIVTLVHIACINFPNSDVCLEQVTTVQNADIPLYLTKLQKVLIHNLHLPFRSDKILKIVGLKMLITLSERKQM